MSVLDQHRFVINPQSFKSNVTKSVHSFKQSFKSSDLIDEHLLKKEDGSWLDKNFLKNDEEIHSQIVKTSISQILGSDMDKQFYPNFVMKNDPVGYKFKGSPAPKKFLIDDQASKDSGIDSKYLENE